MRGAHPRHAEVVETPQEATRGRGGVARSGLDAGTTLEVSLPLEARAPGAARVVVECLCGRLPRTVLEDVRLVVSELVTNSVRHSGAPGGALVELSVEADETMVRVAVADPGGSGVVAARTPDLEGGGGGFGLNLVTALAERWAVERVNGGETRVWAELPRARAPVSASQTAFGLGPAGEGPAS